MQQEPRAEHLTHSDWMARTPAELAWRDNGRPHSRPVWVATGGDDFRSTRFTWD
jgi:hypothetical protein